MSGDDSITPVLKRQSCRPLFAFIATTKPGCDVRLPLAHGVGFITDWTTMPRAIAGLAAMQLPKSFRQTTSPVFARMAKKSPCWFATKTRLSATTGGNSM